MILKFNGQLSDIMGDKDARCNWEKELGLQYEGHQEMEEGITLLRVIDETKCQKYLTHPQIEVLTITEANNVIETKFKEKYKVYNENLMNANLMQKINKGEIDLDEMQPNWTPDQEAEWLYNKGISGISKSSKPKLFE